MAHAINKKLLPGEAAEITAAENAYRAERDALLAKNPGKTDLGKTTELWLARKLQTKIRQIQARYRESTKMKYPGE